MLLAPEAHVRDKMHFVQKVRVIEVAHVHQRNREPLLAAACLTIQPGVTHQVAYEVTMLQVDRSLAACRTPV
jgi:hypothetical protein